jgi:uncharacterized protein YutE (UPF0331/DUF86 family)
VDRRLAKLESCLQQLRRLAPVERERFLNDTALQAQAERWLQLAAEATLDIAHHVIADRGWRTPATYRDAFTVLAENGVIDGELASQLAGWAGLRNVLVHLYLEVDHGLLHDVMSRDLGQLDRFAADVMRAIEQEG